MQPLETVYTASTRLNIPVDLITGHSCFKRLVVQGEADGYSLFGVNQMNYVAKQMSKSNRKPLIEPETKAKIIELFMCENDNQLTRIAKISGIPYHRVFKIIEDHMNDLWNHKNDDTDTGFLTLESKINK